MSSVSFFGMHCVEVAKVFRGVFASVDVGIRVTDVEHIVDIAVYTP